MRNHLLNFREMGQNKFEKHAKTSLCKASKEKSMSINIFRKKMQEKKKSGKKVPLHIVLKRYEKAIPTVSKQML